MLLFGSAFLFETRDIGTRLGSFLGIWLTVLIIDLIALAVFILLAPATCALKKGKVVKVFRHGIVEFGAIHPTCIL